PAPVEVAPAELPVAAGRPAIERLEWLLAAGPAAVEAEEEAPPPTQMEFEMEAVLEEAPPEPAPETELAFRYTVQRGDTLSSIARKYGVTVKDLVEANDIIKPDLIFPGQKLVIPGYLAPKPAPVAEPEPVPVPQPGEEFLVHPVARGDTLSAIAKRYGVTVRQIIEANQVEDPNFIHLGQQLIIPGVAARPKPEPSPPPEPQPAPPPGWGIDLDFPPQGPADAIRGLYVSYFAIGHADLRQHIFDLLETTEFNAVVIDAKGDHGWISYPTQISLAHEIGAARPTARDFETVIAELKRRGIYTIARIVTFKDNPLARSYPEYAAKTGSPNGRTLWIDQEQLSWTDPFLRPVWDYNIQVALEAAHLGFDEVQFDYVRFPTASQSGTPQFSQEASKEARITAIVGFLSAARGQLQPFGVKMAADVFGYTCWRQDDTQIGQDINRMAFYLDVLSPMLYPSTFGSGIPGYKMAIAHPYEVVYESARRAVERLSASTCTLRPWIQDFPDYRFDKRVYGKPEIQAQIKGCFDAGSSGFMVWDPRVQYTSGAYAPVKSHA
ncbi:MAG: putative glycoside hydrolase, partial [Chloroflexota bacterium]